MSRNILLVGALALCSTAASGCQLYLDENEDEYSYCDDTGCYYCDDWGCYPEGGGGGEGWSCISNYDCAAGCYCDDEGYCQEAGFCSYDEDCPEGMVCDDRSSCVPDGSDTGDCNEDADCPEMSFCDEASGYCIGSWDCTNDDQCGMGYECDEERKTCIPSPCETDEECLEGCYCDEDSGQCIESAVCGADGSCPMGMECDVSRNTCVPELPEEATCQGEVTCEELPPTCDEGTNPGIVDGCYNGQCIADEDCPDGAPVYCSDHTDEQSCSDDANCAVVFGGVNCHSTTTGQSCTTPGATCTCDSYYFADCIDAP